MRIRHYYHVYAAGAWAAPLRDHCAALGRAGLDTEMTVGLVGPEQDRQRCREMTGLYLKKWGLPAPVAWLEADEAHEQLTLQQIHNDVHQIPGEFAVLYMHAKGAYRDTDANAAWRRSMTAQLVPGWERCVQLLADHDAVGCHWINQFGDWFFAGNFWWARASHLRRLPPPENENRWTAEVWVSLGACPARAGDLPAPVIHDLLPGYPAYHDAVGAQFSDGQAAIMGDRAHGYLPGQEPGKIATLCARSSFSVTGFPMPGGAWRP